MPDNFVVTSMTIPADVAPAGTVDFPYPAGVAAADLEGGDPAQVILILNDSNRDQGPDYVTVAYGAAITATNTHHGGRLAGWPERHAAGSEASRSIPTPADVIDQISAVLGACAALAALDAAADLPTTVGKVNEIITALKTT